MAGDCSLMIRVDCNFSGRARKVTVSHHVTIPGNVMPDAAVVDVRPKVLNPHPSQ